MNEATIGLLGFILGSAAGVAGMAVSATLRARTARILADEIVATGRREAIAVHATALVRVPVRLLR